MSKLLQIALLSTLALGTLLGCATGGGGDLAAPAEPPKPDYTNEVGENGLLTPRALVSRFIDASGGEEAIRRHQSMTQKGKMELAAMGMEGDLTMKAAAPNKMVLLVEMGGFGSMNTGYNGDIGWSDNPMTGATLLDGKMLKQTARQADFYSQFSYDAMWPTQETVELTEFAGQKTYKVRLVDEDGDETIQYFSAESGLLVGVEATQSNEMGEMTVVTELAGHQDFDGLMIPTETTLKMMGMEIKQTVEEVSFDDVEESAFEPPPSIQALLD